MFRIKYMGSCEQQREQVTSAVSKNYVGQKIAAIRGYLRDDGSRELLERGALDTQQLRVIEVPARIERRKRELCENTTTG